MDVNVERVPSARTERSNAPRTFASVAVVGARLLLGLVLFASGLSGFLPLHPPPVAGLAGAFQDVYFRSHYVLFVDGVQFIAGLMLLGNRFVPLALVTLAAVIANILVFHITMMPMGLPPALVVAALWFIVAWPLRSHFAPLFVAKA